MAAMTQTNLFSWDAIEARSDLDRLSLSLIISPTSAWCNTLR
jgi:hypothetical protein